MTFLAKGWRIAVTLCLLVTIVVFRASPSFASAPPPNDDFNNAKVIAATPFTDIVDTTGATAAFDDPASCGTPRNTVWYSFTPSANVTVIATAGSPFFILSAYTGARGALSQVACSGLGPFSGTSWAATAGVTYHLMVSSLFVFGTLSLHVTAAVPPPNDDFDHATVINSVPFNTFEDVSAATSAPDDPTTCGGTANSVWFAFTPSVNETVFVNSNGAPSNVSAYTGARGALSQVACGTGASWVATAGVTYHIMIAGNGLFGGGIISVQVTAAVPPANDDFDHATAITSLPFTASEDATGATTAPDDPNSCGNANSVWYNLTAPVAETITVSTSGAPGSFNLISAYTGNRGALTQVGCTGTPLANLQFSASAGVTYHIMVAKGFSFGPGGQWSITVTGTLPPANDDFDHAKIVTSLPFSDNLDTTGATTAPDDPNNCFSARNNTVWYQLTPTVNELIVADTTGSGYSPLLSVYTGSRGSLTQVVCSNLNQVTSFAATAGVTYFIMVADNPNFGPAGLLTLKLQGFPPPPNDDIGHATIITKLPYSDSTDTTGATTVPSDPAACFERPAATVWYRFTAPASGTIMASTAGSGYNASITVFRGSPAALTQVTCGIVDTPAFAVAKGVTYYFEISSRFSATGGSLQFAVTSPPDTSGTGPCTAQLTGTISKSITLSAGTTCVQNATVAGPVTLQPGAELVLVNSTVNGELISNGGSALTVCNSTVKGTLIVRAATGFVLIGQGGAGSAACGGNHLARVMLIGGSPGSSNTSGIDLAGNVITGQVIVASNKPNPASVLNPQDAAVEIGANHIGGSLICTGNVPAPVNDGLPNVVSGGRFAQCAGI